MRRSNCRDILTNKNLLSDNDVVQLLRSYVNDSMLMNLKVANVQQSAPHQNISKLFQPQPVLLISPTMPSQGNESAIKYADVQHEDSITNMEVSVDPTMFLADEESIMIEDDEETVSAAEAKIETAKLKILKEESDNEASKKPPVDISHEILNNGNFVCTSCPELFSSNIDLQNHVITHLITSTSSATSTKTQERAIEKPIRKKKLREERVKSRRKKIVIRINPSPRRNGREKARILPKFICAICSKSLSSKRNLHLHHETHKEMNGKFRCDGEGCKKLFGKLENFVKHRQEAHTRRRKNQNEK